jgi:hypothetical protein
MASSTENPPSENGPLAPLSAQVDLLKSIITGFPGRLISALPKQGLLVSATPETYGFGLRRSFSRVFMVFKIIKKRRTNEKDSICIDSALYGYINVRVCQNGENNK